MLRRQKFFADTLLRWLPAEIYAELQRFIAIDSRVPATGFPKELLQQTRDLVHEDNAHPMIWITRNKSFPPEWYGWRKYMRYLHHCSDVLAYMNYHRNNRYYIPTGYKVRVYENAYRSCRCARCEQVWSEFQKFINEMDRQGLYYQKVI